MIWRYVAAVEAIDGEEIWTIREFYDGRGWTARAVAPTGSTHAELREVLRMMTFDIEHRDFLDLDAGEVAHRPGGLRADLTRPGEGPLVPVLDADGLPVVTTVGDLTARHIGRLVRVDYGGGEAEVIIVERVKHYGYGTNLGAGCGYIDQDIPCEVLP